MEIIEEINAKTGIVRIMESRQGPVGAQYLVEVSGEEWKIQRWFFFEDFDIDEAKQFGVKTLYNPDFRQASLNENATWVQIHNLYLKAEQRIVSIFEDYSLFDFSPSDFDGEQRAAWAEHKLIRVLKESYDSISYSLEELSLSSEDLSPYLDTQFEAAEGIAKIIDSGSEGSLKEVRPEDRFLEYRSSDTREWIVEDNRLDILTFVDVYGGEHGPVATLHSTPEKKEVIKDLDWKRTHRGWNPNWEVWEIDLDALEYSLQSFAYRNHIVRVAEPVAQLADIDAPERPCAIRPDWCLPTMKIDSYEQFPSATDFLLLPGIGPSKARALLNADFISLPELAHARATELKDADGIGDKYAQIVKYGAQAAIGVREPAAVQLTKDTSLSVPESQRAIASLAAYGVPQTESTPTLIELYQTNLADLDTAYSRTLYNLYRKGYRSVESIASANVSSLAQAGFIPEDVAKKIHDEVTELVNEQ